MNASPPDERTLTELDHVRLSRLTRGAGPDSLQQPESAIDAVLASADLVSSRKVAADVVTMYSQVELADLTSGAKYSLTVCYPTDADLSRGFVSVLSPVGASLIGLRIGAIARWRTPGGVEGAAEVLALHFQPEASGDYTT